ncbi:MAG: efflux RND transporter periplasmic adaptor subunit, partial [Cyanobacteria bacterium P01_G01_bin.19]
ISELDLGEVRIGQEVRVSLDAFQNQKFAGRVSRISPTTNLQSRQIPIEILLDNPDRKIKAGLLGRVSFFAERESNVVVPKTAIVNQAGTNYIFVTTNKNKDNQSNVSKRKVIIKNSSSEEKVEIIAGLLPGERYVIRSSKPLQDKDVVSLSIISQ